MSRFPFKSFFFLFFFFCAFLKKGERRVEERNIVRGISFIIFELFQTMVLSIVIIRDA